MKITEEEIRPENVFNEYFKLTAIDTNTYFENALDQNDLDKMQDKIVDMGLSSHMMITCKKL